ncbi:MAG: hypothetical protein FJ405_05000 [Verrucomicrobia bacterium]|nr:hypothetical protein [Verrucomicrobiota bacterium]
MTNVSRPSEQAAFVRDRLPSGGLFKDQAWRISPEPFPLDARLLNDLESLGRVLLQFYRSLNRLHRLSEQGKQPPWIAQLLNQGKPESLLEWQRDPAFKNEVPRVIRPDILLTEDGFSITELDSVPGGIGLTAWLNETYADLATQGAGWNLVGGRDQMVSGFSGIFGSASRVHIVVSEESDAYRPEMQWLAGRMSPKPVFVQAAEFTDWSPGDAIYRFFELFDLANISGAQAAVQAARSGEISLTPPMKPSLEEKISSALLWNRNLRDFWRQELGDGFFNRLLKHVPYSWVMDPTPLPPHAAVPELGITDWLQLETFSQRERDLILKVSGYSEQAWGARGVHLGSDLSQADWSAVVREAIREFPQRPSLLQRYHKPRTIPTAYWDFSREQLVQMPAKLRLCPYYFVIGDGDQARARLGGVLATACPADKKIIHGMRDAILMPCCIGPKPHSTV